MKSLITITLLSIALAGSSACFRQTRTVTQRDAMASVRFSGGTADAEFRVDRDGRELWGWTAVESQKLYNAKPGPCVIQVRKGGQIVVQRKALLVDGQSAEIAVP